MGYKCQGGLMRTGTGADLHLKKNQYSRFQPLAFVIYEGKVRVLELVPDKTKILITKLKTFGL